LATVLTDVGEAWVIDVLDATISNQTAYSQYVAWGTGVGGAAKGDTALGAEAAEARVVGVRTQPATDTIQWTATMTAAGTKSIAEAALLTATAAGTCIIRGDFTAVALNANDKIDFTIQLQQT
jgi:hypothetical protein